ncbi:hypothetical protein L1264_00600 [Pseudoalteromonas sp. APAL1]|jgi:hypothetical protein|uniref:hypothetical protein n=1 Tax=Pseudoalteromonas TaxID=53246 RepID=UPI000EDE4EF7|nr:MULTISPECIES: hypothetical protein [unclassified Pseudoalteromonas]MCF2918991.1 hypothetical protein [Pseudoalteromonas sp. APAL1]HCV04869.1 hypothetical protein [Pseudoalteromonas sp.]|tara:strand:- start:2428 stop:3144 length:717 start_codon:yes stop_codon:yes gene_type:complete
MNQFEVYIYFASMGRSGSTLIANYFTKPDAKQFMFVEPNVSENNRFNVNLINQLTDFSLQNDPSSLPETLKSLKGKNYKIGIKEVKSDIHSQVNKLIFPEKIVVTCRNIKDIYLSLVEKHRQQNVPLNEDWSYEYCLRESKYILGFCEKNSCSKIIRYEDFIDSYDYRSELCQLLELEGEGVVDRNFDIYNRTFEQELFKGEIRKRDKPYRHIVQKDIQQAEKLSEECQAYQAYFDYV